ncbi:hypothetical protein BABINDRAFT_163419 [Babjeviella inositovora NRRL Y-12698]|uniref:Uncharacterized protein n=1 Tax=Babjeviella inositovora NRRL Y-12698 TaxID=984486 RepID=A0A1E3QKU6_9ASCO|nr:uncharacterized protein BABINDRAFT_163419 [Babjeviella inositovora NRRL Y-12698]ODQ77712.1 hypothetical protein BABINDRAFT_163419 [Babjeviella inositovora NRRL Y-12698]
MILKITLVAALRHITLHHRSTEAVLARLDHRCYTLRMFDVSAASSEAVLHPDYVCSGTSVIVNDQLGKF